jgi:hypothetical protein
MNNAISISSHLSEEARGDRAERQLKRLGFHYLSRFPSKKGGATTYTVASVQGDLLVLVGHSMTLEEVERFVGERLREQAA